MAKNKNSSYTIELDVASSPASKQVLKEFRDTVNSTQGDVNALSKQYLSMTGNVKDITILEQQYNKVIEEQLQLKDDEIKKLEAKKVSIAASVKLSKEEKAAQISQLDSQIKSLNTQKQFIKAKQQETKLLVKTDGVLKKYLKSQNQIIGKAAAKNWKQTKENVQAIGKAFVSIGQAIKNIPAHTLSALTKIPAALTSAVRKAPKAAGKALKYGAIGAAGIAGAAISAGIAGAENIQEKHKALSSLKSGIDTELVDEVFIATGATYPEIVSVLNTISGLTKDNNELIAAAKAEVLYPGMGKALLTSSNRKDSLSAQQWLNIADQIKQQTGIQDMQPVLEAMYKNRNVTRGLISQSDYVLAAAALRSKGIDEERVERIISNVAKKGGDFLTNLNNTDLTKFVIGQDKQRLKGDKLNLAALDPNKQRTQTDKESSAESIVQTMRELQLTRDKAIEQVLKPVATILKTFVEEGILKDVVNGIGELARIITPLVIPLIKWLMTGFKYIMMGLEYVIQWAKDKLGIETEDEARVKQRQEDLKKSIKESVKQGKDLDAIKFSLDVIRKHGLYGAANLSNYTAEAERKKYGSTYQQGLLERANYAYTPFLKLQKQLSGTNIGAKAQGGIATVPSLCGEAGPELVIPLDNSRSGRANQIINNFNTSQSFNMQPNQQTPLAFAQSVGRNPFVKRFAYGN